MKSGDKGTCVWIAKGTMNVEVEMEGGQGLWTVRQFSSHTTVIFSNSSMYIRRGACRTPQEGLYERTHSSTYQVLHYTVK